MTLDEHISEQRSVVDRIAKEQGIELTPKHWAEVMPLVEKHARTMYHLEQQLIALSKWTVPQ